ncbi:anthrone oxygenase family protein [Nonomuraea typhae]|uniref:anthrone oxygenase family protein n=1 Tax=Nonomuraea typhae TaxID=2603600 RepID=UPI0012F8E23F|nr:anthrone oxygenase family protein [Nonomuraea typhae]
MRTPARYIHGAALLATGLLAGAFGYGAANVIPTFGAVALDVRLTFHTTMMTMNEPVMQSAMALAILSTFGLAIAARGPARRLALGAGALALTSLLITVFGNIPLHAYFRKWAAGPVPDGYAEIFQRWELFHTLRTFTALIAFVLIVAVAVVARPSARRTAPVSGGAVMT